MSKLFKPGPLGKALGFGDKPAASVDLGMGKSFVPFNFGGVSGTTKDGAINIGATPERTAAIGDLTSTLTGQGQELRGFLPGIGNTFTDFVNTVRTDLIPKVSPGFGALSTATAGAFKTARERLQSSRQATTGNLKDDLARRNISGSSFAQDTATRAQAEFDLLDRELAAEEGRALSTAALEELNATTQLIEKAFQAEVGNITTQLSVLEKAMGFEAQAKGIPLDDMNNILTIGTNILNSSLSQFGANARAEAELAAKAAAGEGQRAGQIGSLIGGGLGFMFGGPGGAAIGSGIGSGIATTQ